MWHRSRVWGGGRGRARGTEDARRLRLRSRGPHPDTGHGRGRLNGSKRRDPRDRPRNKINGVVVSDNFRSGFPFLSGMSPRVSKSLLIFGPGAASTPSRITPRRINQSVPWFTWTMVRWKTIQDETSKTILSIHTPHPPHLAVWPKFRSCKSVGLRPREASAQTNRTAVSSIPLRAVRDLLTVHRPTLHLSGQSNKR